MRFIFACLAATLLALLPAKAENLYVFGDSLSDNGNLFQESYGGFPPKSTYSWGRASNGATWTERLGYHLGTAPGLNELRSPWGGFQSDNRGYNFAHYGAVASPVARGSRGQAFGEQIGFFNWLARENYLSISANDRFVVWAGANDYLALGITDTASVVQHIQDGVWNLGMAGAQNIFVLDQPHWGDTPLGYQRGDRAGLNALADAHNSALQYSVDVFLRESGIDANYVPVSALYADVQANPGLYGFDIVRPGEGTSGHCLGDGIVLGACPSSYAFYDAIHPSAAMHQQISQLVSAHFSTARAAKQHVARATARSAPVMALHQSVLRDEAGLTTQAGLARGETSRTVAFAMSETAASPNEALRDVFGGDTGAQAFQLMGGRTALDSRTRIGFVHSRGSLDSQATRETGGRFGRAVSLAYERDFGNSTLRISQSRTRQAVTRSRATGFDADPVAIADFEQRDELTLAGVSHRARIGGFEVTPSLDAGRARTQRSAIRERARTSMVTLDTPATTIEETVSRAAVNVSATHAGKTRHWRGDVTISAAETGGNTVSAWSLIGERDFTQTTGLPARRAMAISAGVGMTNRDGWSLALTGVAGRDEQDDHTSLRMRVTREW